jgi:hypothetical protein
MGDGELTNQELLYVVGIIDTSSQGAGSVEVVDTDQESLSITGTCIVLAIVGLKTMKAYLHCEYWKNGR